MTYYVELDRGVLDSKEQYEAALYAAYRYRFHYVTEDGDLARAICADIGRKKVKAAQDALDKACADLAASTTPPEPQKAAEPAQVVEKYEPCDVSKKCGRWFAKAKP